MVNSSEKPCEVWDQKVKVKHRRMLKETWLRELAVDPSNADYNHNLSIAAYCYC